MLTDRIDLKGKVQIDHLDKTGALVKQYNFDNLVVASGKEFIVARMIGVAIPVISHIGLGSSDIIPTSDQTALVSPVGDRVVFDNTPVLTGSNITIVSTFSPGVSTGDIREAGVFNAVSGGTMFSRVKFGLITKPVDDTLVVTWNISVL